MTLVAAVRCWRLDRFRFDIHGFVAFGLFGEAFFLEAFEFGQGPEEAAFDVGLVSFELQDRVCTPEISGDDIAEGSGRLRICRGRVISGRIKMGLFGKNGLA